MRLSIIVAAAENNVIGRGNALPWHISEDLKFFKKTTMSKPIIMGRKTYDSIGRPLPGRMNIVITRNTNWHAEGVRRVDSLGQALFLVEGRCMSDALDEMFVIGGEQIYRLAIEKADRIYMTRIKDEVEGDAFFPAMSPSEWQLVSTTTGTDDAEFGYEFQIYDRCWR